LIEMAVKFWRVPKIASLIKDSALAVRDCGEVCAIELKRLSMMAVKRNTMAHSRKQNCREGYAGGKAGNQREAWLTWRGTSLRNQLSITHLQWAARKYWFGWAILTLLIAFL